MKTILGLLVILAMVGCSRVEVDCKNGKVTIQNKGESINTLTQQAAMVLSQCPKDQPK